MKRSLKTAALLLAVCFLLSSCDLRINWIPGRQILAASENIELSDAEVRILALSCKAEFESYYLELLGGDFWEKPVSEGMSYEDYVREYFVFRECRALIYLNEQAIRDGLTLSDVEAEEVHRAAERCFSRMTEDEKAYSKARLSDMEALMKLYALALEEIRLLSPGEVSVSDEESRVVDFSVIHVGSEAEAEAVKERLSKGESFLSAASECTIDERISYSAAKGELLPEIEAAVFSMQSGETSDIIRAEDGSCYIIRVSEAYNTLLSLNNKRNIRALRAFDGWSGFYESQEKKITIRRSESLWNDIRLNAEGDYPDFGFFTELQ